MSSATFTGVSIGLFEIVTLANKSNPSKAASIPKIHATAPQPNLMPRQEIEAKQVASGASQIQITFFGLFPVSITLISPAVAAIGKRINISAIINSKAFTMKPVTGFLVRIIVKNPTTVSKTAIAIGAKAAIGANRSILAFESSLSVPGIPPSSPPFPLGPVPPEFSFGSASDFPHIGQNADPSSIFSPQNLQYILHLSRIYY